MSRLKIMTVFFIVGLGVAGFYLVNNRQVEFDDIKTEDVFLPDKRRYQNEKYGFSLFYPKSMSVSEYDEGGDANTFVFQNAESMLGFQIFVIPYNKEQIGEERFEADIPTGVRKDTHSITIDGVPGVSFHVSNTTLGETSEVWLVHGGYLYEVLTLRSTESLLEEVIKSWKFL